MSSEKRTGPARALRCRECGHEYPIEPIHVCEFCFGPLEVVYDYDWIAARISREKITQRAPSMWRYRELLPIDGEPKVGVQNGFTPLVYAERLAKALGVREVYVKNDAVCHPTLSFKDRVVSVALSKALEFGFDTAACASTGNLAGSVAANAAAAGMDAFVFIPHDLERGKVLGAAIYGAHVVGISGPYDKVNRLCSEIAGRYGWAFVNVNIRPFYAEGSKTLAFEIMEQLGWRAPEHIVVPMASGSLLTKVHKAIREFVKLGLVEDAGTKLYGAQAAGCGPIAEAVQKGREIIRPVAEPKTIAKSLAIGDPADGFYAVRAIRETGGWAEAVSDEEIVEGMRLLAETEGIFTETAGGVTVATAKRLIASGRIPKDASVVLCITGNGLKTLEAVEGTLAAPPVIEPNLKAFDALYETLKARRKAA